LDQNYFPEMGESNPFLHMGLHLAIRDQIQTNRPLGITKIFNTLAHESGNKLHAEHLLMERLAECLWQAQRKGILPDEQTFLMACQALIA